MHQQGELPRTWIFSLSLSFFVFFSLSSPCHIQMNPVGIQRVDHRPSLSLSFQGGHLRTG